MDLKKKNKRETCKYGSDCYQKNPFHLAKFYHPKKGADKPLENAAKKTKLSLPPSDNDDQKGKKIINLNKTHEKEDIQSIKLHEISDSDDEQSNKKKQNQDEAGMSSNQCSAISDSITDLLPSELNARLNNLYVVQFPQDLFSFYDFCLSVNSKSPKMAVRDVGLDLVGPFDYLSGDIMKSCSSDEIIRHYRYFYDPPEFYTVLESTSSLFHYGYFFDEPDTPPLFIASNDPSKNCTLKIVAPNIYGAVNAHILSYLETCDPFKKMKVQKLQSSLVKWANKDKFSLDPMSTIVKLRNAKVVTRTFNEVGIVVPYDKKTDVGYRPLAENNKTLKDLLTKIADCETESERSIRWSKIEHIITFASIAADECDFGTPLELGMNMFCMGHPCFHRTAGALMSMAYNLLGRNHFSKVIDIHLKNRIKGSNLNFAAVKK